MKNRKEAGFILELLPPGNILRWDDNLWPFPSFANCGLWLCKMIQLQLDNLIPTLEGLNSMKLSRDCKIPFNLSIQDKESAQI